MKRIKLNHIFSMKIPLFLLFLIIGFLPVFIQSKFMNQSFSQTQIDGRMIEVQNQCLITGDRLTRAGYLLKETHDPLIDKELDTIADIFNGRIVVVDQNFRIVKDTFGLADGRINVSEPIVKCFRGENVAFHEADKHYVVTTAQICDSEEEKNVIGVLLMTVSTENIVSNVSKVAEKMSILSRQHQVICITHLSQIAAMADAHYLIEKNVENEKTISSIRLLSKEEEIEELARLIGGAKITETTIHTVTEMKGLAEQAKIN